MTNPDGGRPAASPPPDAGLQAERTSLSWARTWAVLGVVVTLVVKLVAETSVAAAAWLSALAVVPLIALLRIRHRHEQRVRRFVDAHRTHQTDWAYNTIVVGVVLVLSTVGLAAVLLRAAVGG